MQLPARSTLALESTSLLLSCTSSLPLTFLFTYYNSEKCLGTCGVNKRQDTKSSWTATIKGQQSLKKWRNDDAETHYGNHSVENAAWQEIKQGIPLNGKQRSINKPYEPISPYLLIWVIFFLKPLFVRAEWKQLGETRERPGGGLPAGEAVHSNREKATHRTPPINLKIAGNTGKKSIQTVPGKKNTPDVKGTPKGEVSRDMVFLSTNIWLASGAGIQTADLPSAQWGCEMFSYSFLMCGFQSLPGFVGLAALNCKSQNLLMLGYHQGSERPWCCSGLFNCNFCHGAGTPPNATSLGDASSHLAGRF